MIPRRFQDLVAELTPVADRFAAAGHRLYLVGGIVRDLFAEAELHGDHLDLDLTTDARPDEIKALVGPLTRSLWTQGERFGTIGFLLGDRRVEITTHRAEAYTPDSRKPDVVFSTDIEADLSRRDFTINAMALEITGDQPALIDPFDGAADLVAKRLRTPLSPDISFDDDPLRMLRAARFVARFEMTPDAELVAAVGALASRLEIVAVERVREEFDKLMVVADPSAGLWFACDTGLAEQFFPELPRMRVEQDPIHRHKDVLTHTIAVTAETSPRLKLRLAALFHDIGKPQTRAISGNGVSFHHHEVVGARMTRDRMRALKYSNEMVTDVSQLVFLHLRFHTYRMGWTDSAVRRFVRDAGEQLDDLVELTRCDCTTRNRRKAETLSRRMDELVERIDELRESDALHARRPEIDGDEVMVHLGIGPGRAVGAALAFLLELRVEHGDLGHDEVIRRLDEWWVEHGAALAPRS